MSITKHCWPTPWLEAAMNAGFATYRGEDGWEFLTDQMRDMLAAFGGALVAAERKRWTEVVMTELDSNGQAHAIVTAATRA